MMEEFSNELNFDSLNISIKKKYTRIYSFSFSLSLTLFPAKGERIYEQQKKKWWIANFFIPSPATAIFHSFALRDFKNKFYVLLSFILIYPLPAYPLSVLLFHQQKQWRLCGEFFQPMQFYIFFTSFLPFLCF